MRVAIVWNQDNTGVINRFGQPSPEVVDREEVESVVAALQEGGHQTLLCEGDKGLLAALEAFMPPDPQGRPSGIVFNLAWGIQGECREAHVSAILEMAGVPYTGPSPLGHGLALDKVVTKRLIRDCGVPTPNFRVMRKGTESIRGLRFPVVVKPRHEYASLGLQLLHEPNQLKQAVEAIVTQYAQEALVEEYIDGREITVALLGNGELEVLPLVEYDFGDGETRYLTREAPPMRVCPAQTAGKLATVLRDISVTTFLECHCRDYARVDLRIDRSGQPFVLEINNMPALGMHLSYVTAARTAGYSFSGLINRILDVAYTRYFGTGIPTHRERGYPVDS
ncbi:ATP-grasp domain-containing protein [Mesorhizobium sp.]|uniref:D-alanine--D-alanine ligase family protein n=1 Tax=Mesorhizobium sp. TaxID=1871066 RepID=UPI000FE5BEC6|nr:ATP-grasp domain-containing protein [Mesorhizobium sp.]RWN24076.1 MAG: ATP-grasp domain-containing protein [Mesorhizobium sp.]RWQ61503.1 MAG: ATP-grasp domain-containing protein [Mesorhizobium sp.]